MKATTRSVFELLSSGMTRPAICRQLDIAKSTLAYHVEKLRFAGSIPEPEIIATPTDWASVQIDLNSAMTRAALLSKHSISASTLERAISVGRVIVTKKKPKDMTVAEYAAAFGLRPATPSFRRRIVAKLIEEAGERRCAICRATEWMNGKLPVELDHIDGNSSNNIPANFRIACCNCHAQTPTFRGRNTAKAKAKLAREAGLEPARPDEVDHGVKGQCDSRYAIPAEQNPAP